MGDMEYIGEWGRYVGSAAANLLTNHKAMPYEDNLHAGGAVMLADPGELFWYRGAWWDRDELVCELANEGAFDTAGDYGEPGYTKDHEDGILLLDWGAGWDVRDLAREGALAAVTWLETRGCELLFGDEWTVDHDHDKAYRTCSDSAFWEPSFVWTYHDGYEGNYETLTTDDDPLEWILWAATTDNFLPSHVATVEDLAGLGFVLFPYMEWRESGWHQGMDADPMADREWVRDAFIEDLGLDARLMHDEDLSVVVRTTEQSQFYVRYQVWVGPGTRVWYWKHETRDGWADEIVTRADNMEEVK